MRVGEKSFALEPVLIDLYLKGNPVTALALGEKVKPLVLNTLIGKAVNLDSVSI